MRERRKEGERKQVKCTWQEGQYNVDDDEVALCV